MIGAKSISSIAIGCVGLAAFGLLWLFPEYLIGVDKNALFWAGFLSAIVGPSLIWFWQIHHQSKYYFRYAYNERPWEDESLFIALGKHRVTIGQNLDGDAFDFSPGVHILVFVFVIFVVGLITIDSRAMSLVRRFPERFWAASSQFCPDQKATEQPMSKASKGACALIRRAYRLGYAKNLGDCALGKSRRINTQLCERRLRDEPWLHYAWRLLAESIQKSGQYLANLNSSDLGQNFAHKLSELENLTAMRQQSLSTAPRASHHIWTNLDIPPDWKGSRTTKHSFGQPGCVERYKKLPHRPLASAPSSRQNPSEIVEHVIAKLLFESRYTYSVGYCREYHVHWQSANHICEQLVQDPEDVLKRYQGWDTVQVVNKRFDLLARKKDSDQRLKNMRKRTNDVSLSPIRSTITELSENELQRFISFQCYIEETRNDVIHRTHSLSIHNQIFEVHEIRAPASIPSDRELIDRYRYLASLLAPRFHYGGLMSIASLDATEALFDFQNHDWVTGRNFRFAQLDYLADMDIFLGNAWILEKEHLQDLYPYHLHLKNYIKVFRRHYVLARGRL